MIWSLNEIEAETKKAIRGAGLAWGLAEEGAKAARWLAARAIDPMPALMDILDRHDRGENISTAIMLSQTGRWEARDPICPIVLGATLCDRADLLVASPFAAGPVARPLLIIPFAARAAGMLKRELRLNLNGDDVLLSAQGELMAKTTPADPADVDELRCRIAEGGASMPVSRMTNAGLAVDRDRWSRLMQFAHRTYVPATERSRLEGAGAGMIDND